MTGDQLKDKFYTRIGELEGASSYDSDAVLEFLNTAYEKLRAFGAYPYDIITEYCSNPVTQLAGDVLTGASSITVDDAEGFEIGCPIVLCDGASIIDQVQITNIVSNTISFVPALQNDYSEDDYVYGKFIILPYTLQDSSRLISIVRVSGTRALKEYRQKVEELYPDPTFPGAPEYYIQGPQLKTQILSLTAGAGTSATTVTHASQFATARTLGWLVVNTTRTRDAYITAINTSTNVATLDRSITGQTSGDGFGLYLKKTMLELHPTPDNVYIWKVTGKRGCYPPIELAKPVDLPEDWIAPLLDEAEALCKARPNAVYAQKKEADFAGFLEQKLGDRHVGEDKILSASPWGIEELDISNF